MESFFSIGGGKREGPWRPPSILKLRKSSYNLNYSINVTNPLNMFLLNVNLKKLTINYIFFLYLPYM